MKEAREHSGLPYVFMGDKIEKKKLLQGPCGVVSLQQTGQAANRKIRRSGPSCCSLHDKSGDFPSSAEDQASIRGLEAGVNMTKHRGAS